MGVIGGSSLTPASASTPSYRSGLPGGVHIGGVEDPIPTSNSISHTVGSEHFGAIPGLRLDAAD